MRQALEVWVVSGGDEALHALSHQADNGGNEVQPGEGAKVRGWATLEGCILELVLLDALQQAPLDSFQEACVLDECLQTSLARQAPFQVLAVIAVMCASLCSVVALCNVLC